MSSEISKANTGELIDYTNSVPERISWSFISNQILSVLNIQRGIFYTLIELLFRPGKAVRNHLFKDRKRLLNPIRFLVLSSTIATLVTFHYLDFTEIAADGDMVKFNSGVNQARDSHVEGLFISRFNEFLQQFSNLSFFVITPVGAVIAWFFCKKKFNVPELAVSQCFMWSMVNVFGIMLVPLTQFNPIFVALLTLISVAYPLYFFTSFLNEGWVGFLKSFFIGIINSFMYLLILLIFFIIAAGTFLDFDSIINPNSMTF